MIWKVHVVLTEAHKLLLSTVIIFSFSNIALLIDFIQVPDYRCYLLKLEFSMEFRIKRIIMVELDTN